MPSPLFYSAHDLATAMAATADASLSPWQKCKRCGLKVDLPEDVAKGCDAVYCGPDCTPGAPFHGIDVSHLRPMRMR